MMTDSCTPDITLYYHTHWDREWYEPFGIYGQRLVKVVDDILTLLKTNQLPCFTLDGQTVVLSDYWQHRPETRPEIEALVKAGRLSVGPWFVMPDEFLVSGESLLRNLQLGMQQAQQLGQKTMTGYLPDTFGHSADMPIILSHVGINTAVVWRGVNPKQSVLQWKSHAFDEGVTTLHLTSGYFQHHAHMEATLEDVKKGLDAFVAPIKTALPKSWATALLPVGADHLGVTQPVVNTMTQAMPNAGITTIDAYMNDLVAAMPAIDATVVQGELVDCSGQYLLPGVYSSRLYLKQANRKLEWLLTRQLEPLGALAQLAQQPVVLTRTQQAQLWETLLLNHPHDSICGCSVDAVHRDNEYRFEQVETISTHLLEQLQWQWFNALPATKKTNDVLLTHMGTQPYTGVVPVVLKTPFVSFTADNIPEGIVLPSGQVLEKTVDLDKRHHFDTTWLPLSENKVLEQQALLWVENIQPLSISRLNLDDFKMPPAAECVRIQQQPDGALVLANALLQVTIALTGDVTALDLTTKQVYPLMHRLQRQLDNGDSYNGAPVLGAETEYAQLERVSVISEGPLQVDIALYYRFPLSQLPLKTIMTLQAGSPLLRFNTQFVNTLKQHKIQAVFNSTLPVDTLEAEGHINVVKRQYDPNYRLQQVMPAPKQKELKANTGPIQRFVFWQQQGVITQGLAEYEVFENTLAITLLRSFGMLSSDATGVRGSHAGPPLPTPEGQCVDRPIKCHYAWQPAPTALALYPAADLYYGAVTASHFPSQWQRHKPDTIAAPLKKSCFSAFALDNTALVLMALIPLGDGLFTLRVANPTPQPQCFSLPKTITVNQCQGAAQLEKSEITIAPQNFVTLTLQG